MTTLYRPDSPDLERVRHPRLSRRRVDALLVAARRGLDEIKADYENYEEDDKEFREYLRFEVEVLAALRILRQRFPRRDS